MMTLGICLVSQHMAILIHHLEIHYLTRELSNFIFSSNWSLGMNFFNKTLVIIGLQLKHYCFNMHQTSQDNGNSQQTLHIEDFKHCINVKL